MVPEAHSVAKSVPFLYNVLVINLMMKYRVIQTDCRGFNNLPTRSPDVTPCDFFLWCYVKDQVYVPPLPASIPELKVRIRTAIETITADMLQIVWNELDYRVDVCRITKGVMCTRYVTKTWSAVLLNKKNTYNTYNPLSSVLCVKSC